jgi:hypothetical protein
VPEGHMAYTSPTKRRRSGSSKRVQNDPNIEPIAMTAVSAISAPDDRDDNNIEIALEGVLFRNCASGSQAMLMQA